MASVVLSYRDAGLFDNWPIRYLETHQEVSALQKIGLALQTWLHFLMLLFKDQVVLLHCHIAEHISFLRKSFFMLTARCFGIPYIMHMHGSELNTYYDNKCGAFFKGYFRFIVNHASAIIVISEEWRHWLLSMATNKNIILLQNPIQLPEKIEYDDSSGRTQNVIFLGRLVPQKGISDLLVAFQRVVQKSSKPVHLWIGGDGDMTMVETLIKSLKMNDYVSLLGWIQNETKDQLLREADALVLPSYNEVLPMAILEALAYGIPVIASKVGSIPDAVTHGSEGFLINPGEIDDLAEYIFKLTHDIELRKTLRGNARSKAETNFSSEMVLSKLGEIYQSLGARHA